MTAPNLPPVMTIAEAARWLRVSERHAYELAASGQLPGAVTLGRRRLVVRDRLLTLLGLEVPPPAPTEPQPGPHRQRYRLRAGSKRGDHAARA